VNRRKSSPHNVANRLSEEDRQRIMFTCEATEFAELPPGQIVLMLLIGAAISVLIASTECSKPMAWFTGADGQGHHRSHIQYQGCVNQARLRCGAET